MTRAAVILGLAFTVAATIVMATARSAHAAITVGKLLDTSQNIIGQKIAYPGGSHCIQGEIIVILPGEVAEWRIHSLPMYAYLMEGELLIDYKGKGLQSLKQGAAAPEAQKWPRRGANTGKSPAESFVVYTGADGVRPHQFCPRPDRAFTTEDARHAGAASLI